MSGKLKRLFVIGFLLVPWLCACSFLSKNLMSENALLLMAPGLTEEHGVLKQKVTLVREGKSQSFVVITELMKETTQVAVLMPAGQRVLTMKYDGQKFESTNYTGMAIPAREIFALMQFAIWPEKALGDYYRPQSGWQMVLSEQQRQLLKQKNPVLNVWFNPYHTEVHHLRHKYQVIIEPLESPQ
jgi:co-chaperonin GroES (HSP10)